MGESRRWMWMAAALASLAVSGCQPEASSGRAAAEAASRAERSASPPVLGVTPPQASAAQHRDAAGGAGRGAGNGVGGGSAAVRPPSAPARPAAQRGALLQPAAGGDGDSWKDTRGREYRLGLVNTPEHNECFGGRATSKRKALVAGGFRARVYQVDDYGRSVSVVTNASGVNVNVYLARHGYADDRYLAQYRHENPGLARQLEVAFAAAKRERAGLWGACGGGQSAAAGAAPAPAPAGGACHSAYSPCIPVKGDGSGNGAANDLDCGDVRKKVTVRRVGVDPYRLDADGDGYGCDSYG